MRRLIPSSMRQSILCAYRKVTAVDGQNGKMVTKIASCPAAPKKFNTRKAHHHQLSLQKAGKMLRNMRSTKHTQSAQSQFQGVGVRGSEQEPTPYLQYAEHFSDSFHNVLGIQVFRSEEHTSELQSRENLVCRLLLEKKKKTGKREIILKTQLPDMMSNKD